VADARAKILNFLDRYNTKRPYSSVSVRPIAIGKKSWLFTGSERAGKRAAAIQSFIGTTKLNDLDPYAWMQDTLEKLPTWPNSRIYELLPLTISGI